MREKKREDFYNLSGQLIIRRGERGYKNVINIEY